MDIAEHHAMHRFGLVIGIASVVISICNTALTATARSVVRPGVERSNSLLHVLSEVHEVLEVDNLHGQAKSMLSAKYMRYLKSTTCMELPCGARTDISYLMDTIGSAGDEKAVVVALPLPLLHCLLLLQLDLLAVA